MKKLFEKIPTPTLLAGSFILGFALVSLSDPVNDGYGYFDSWWPVFLGIFFTVTVWTFKHAQAESKKKIRMGWPKVKRTLIRMGIAAGLSLIIFRDVSWPAFFFTMYVWGIFAVEFDLFYNYWKNYRWHYLGTTGLQDRIFKHMPWLLLLLDLLVLSGGIIGFILTT